MKTLDRRGDAAAPGRRHLVVDARLHRLHALVVITARIRLPRQVSSAAAARSVGDGRRRQIRASTAARSLLSPRRHHRTTIAVGRRRR